MIYVPSPGENVDSVNKSSASNSSAASTPTVTPPPELERPYTPNALPNELNEFASYNYIITIGCLSPYETNNPDLTYRKNPPGIVILKSGGGLGDKKTTLAYEGEFKYEFFVDNLEIMSIVGPNIKTKQTNATMVSFDILEPYSMGTFLQILAIAANEAGYKSYLTACWLLTIDFVGWDINGDRVDGTKLRRMYPLKFNKVDFKVTESGSQYSCSGHPWHEISYTDQVQASKSDIRVEGSTLLEICQTGIQSIATHFNNRETERENAGETLMADQYVILFPKETGNKRMTASTILGGSGGGGGATIDVAKLYKTGRGSSASEFDSDAEAEIGKVVGVSRVVGDEGSKAKNYAETEANVNSIGQSKLVNDYLAGKKQPFGRPKFVEKEDKPGFFERGQLQIQQNGTVVTFKSGTTIQDMIEELILLSEYGLKIADATPDDNGLIPWFRIDSQVYVVPDEQQESLGGRFPLIYVFVVTEFLAHISNYAPVSNAYPGYKNLAMQAQKEYNYIYTGKNDDVLDFDIKFNTAFYSAITPFGGLNTLVRKTEKADQPFGPTKPNIPQKNISGTGNFSSATTQVQQEAISTNIGAAGTSQGEDPKVQIARNINYALTNSNADLIMASITIWGDPYFIADSGMGNYSAESSPVSINITADGTMDYERSEVDVLVNFKSPIDFLEDGKYNFSSGGEEQLVPSFSGLYRVNMVTHRFNEGIFTQELKLIRRKNQIGYDLPADTQISNDFAAMEQGEIDNAALAVGGNFKLETGFKGKLGSDLDILL